MQQNEFEYGNSASKQGGFGKSKCTFAINIFNPKVPPTSSWNIVLGIDKWTDKCSTIHQLRKNVKNQHHIKSPDETSIRPNSDQTFP